LCRHKGENLIAGNTHRFPAVATLQFFRVDPLDQLGGGLYDSGFKADGPRSRTPVVAWPFDRAVLSKLVDQANKVKQT